MKYDLEVRDAIARWAPAYGVTIDPALVHAIIEKESTHGRTLVTDEGRGRFSYGPMMVLDSTARGLGFPDPPALARSAAVGISAGVKYLATLLHAYPGDVERAIASYNAGPSPATRPFRNQTYVDRVLGFWRVFRRAAPAVGAGIVALVVIVLLVRRSRAAA